MTLDRQFTYNLPFTLETVEDCLQYIKDHYAEHQEEAALRITDFNTFRSTIAPFRIGDGGSNYVNFASDGEMTLGGTAKVVRHIRVGAGSWKLGAAGPTPGFWSVFGTMDFDTSHDDEVHYTIMVPHRWDGTTDIEFVVDWAHEIASVAGVTWGLEYYSMKAGEAVGGGTATLVEPSGASVINVMQRTTFDPGIDADLLEASDTLGMRLYRDVSDAGDTLAGDARLINTHFHFTMDKLGMAT